MRVANDRSGRPYSERELDALANQQLAAMEARRLHGDELRSILGRRSLKDWLVDWLTDKFLPLVMLVCFPQTLLSKAAEGCHGARYEYLVRFARAMESGELAGEDLKCVVRTSGHDRWLVKALCEGFGIEVPELLDKGRNGELTSEAVRQALSRAILRK